jgi:TonB family protein
MTSPSRARSLSHSVVRIVILFLIASEAWSQTAFLQNMVGQKLILRHLADRKDIKMKAEELDRLKGTCDLAVQILATTWDRGTARIQLETIGTPSLFGSARRKGCRKQLTSIALEVSGFAVDEPGEEVFRSIGRILQTPEQYLSSQGIEFKLPPIPEDEIPITPTTTSAKPLLTVDGVYTEAARKHKLQGRVRMTFIVGTDGLAHAPRIVNGIGDGLGENALRALSLWRFEPAKVADRLVASTGTIEMVFRLL